MWQGFSELSDHTSRRIFSCLCQHERRQGSSRLLAQGASAHCHAGSCQLHQQCAKFSSIFVLAQDLQEAKRIIALLLVNELRNLGDLRHADPPHGWMWAERLSPDLLEHLQQLQNRAQQYYNFVAPTAKKRARQFSRCAPVSSALCLCIRLRVQFVQVADKGPRSCSAEEISVHSSYCTAACVSHFCPICVPQVFRARFNERQCGHHAHMSS